MNTPHKQQTKGFTIIEVVLVLAIAGLIFLMVLMVFPSTQSAQRDAQRKSDITRINTQLEAYKSSNRNDIPSETKMNASSTGFVTRYLKGSGSVAGDEYKDPSTGEGYTINTGEADPLEGQINYQVGRICGEDGAAVASVGSGSSLERANARNYVLRIHLESQHSPYCVDNR